MCEHRIKFRVWLSDKTNKSNEQMIYGEVGHKSWKELWDNYNAWLGKIKVIQQFTGLSDKNIKDIYDGDIILETRSHNDDDPNSYSTYEKTTKYQIYWDAGYHGFRMFSMGRKHNSTINMPQLNNSNIEIIGNIYENPELNKT